MTKENTYDSFDPREALGITLALVAMLSSLTIMWTAVKLCSNDSYNTDTELLSFANPEMKLMITATVILIIALIALSVIFDPVDDATPLMKPEPYEEYNEVLGTNYIS